MGTESRRRVRLGAVLAACTLLGLCGDSARGADGPDLDFFEKKVRPVLVDNCYDCHGPEAGKGKAKLRVDSRESLLRGGDSGPAIVPGAPDQSLLIRAIRHDGAAAMPPKSKLPPEEIQALSAWIEKGAPWPGPATAASSPAEPGETSPGLILEARGYWAFQPLKRSSPPPASDPAWADSPIDRFIRAKLDSAGLHPAPSADKRTLIRRATYDLTGLPPTPEDVEAFLRDDAPNAFETVVDRLLASPRYGERWGRHWLDVVRYADSNGMDDNLAYPDAWRYRNYVVDSFNADKPFNRFLAEQIAGDLLAEREPANRDELLIATGFLAIGPKMLAEDDPVKQQMDVVDEQLDTTGRAFLALTIGCARCHDHKFDPIPITDYYAMAGIFKSTRTMLSYRVDSKWNAAGLGGPRAALRLEDLEAVIDRHDDALVNGATNRMSDEERTARAKLLEEAKAEYAAIPKAMAVAEGTVEDMHVFLRGNHLTPGAAAPRGFLKAVAGPGATPLDKTSSGRLELAEWLASPANPLTARVAANRIWHWHFGGGIVPTVDNFGKLGSPPSHPELLDRLAVELVEGGWSLKTLHRRIMSSQTYRMGSRWDERSAKVDPENALLWRFPRRRLDAESVRDSLLAVSGELDTSVGRTVLPSTPFLNLSLGGAAAGLKLDESRRRSIYLPILRSALYEPFQAFDFPDPAVSTGGRGTSTSASQALFMMNGPTMKIAVESLVRALSSDPNQSRDDRLKSACRWILGRPAEADEIKEWKAFLDRAELLASRSGGRPETAREAAWRALCRALSSSNEFMYVY